MNELPPLEPKQDRNLGHHVVGTLAEDSYRPPLDQLLRLGETKLKDFSTDYVALGFTAEHVPELIRMMSDEELHTAARDNLVVRAPVHAWRTLAGLGAEAAIGPLLALLVRVDDHQDDWVSEEVPEVLGAFGAAALGPVTAYLADAAHGEWARVAAARALSNMGKRHPRLRDGCVASLIAQLERHADQSETLNAFLSSYLLELRAVEALPAMERAFASGRMDESVRGDFEDAEITLGLKTHRLHPRKPNRLTKLAAKLRGLLGQLADGEESMDEPREASLGVPAVAAPKVGRNEPCPCGSGKKSKKCCG